MDRDLAGLNDPMGRPLGDEVFTGRRSERSIESGRTDRPDPDLEIGEEKTILGAEPPKM